MGKMLKLLNKANELRDEKFAAQTPIHQPLLAAETIVEETPGSVFTGRTPSILMIAIALIALASVYLGYRSIQEIHASRAISQNIFEEYRLSQIKITEFKESLTELQLSHEKEIMTFKKEIQMLQDSIRQSTQKIEDIKIDQNLMRSVISNLKDSNQKISKNFDSLGQQIQQLEQEVSQIKGDLPWEKSPTP